jgi:two-component system cell cycle sensor histidine kinase/response regulator CckA
VSTNSLEPESMSELLLATANMRVERTRATILLVEDENFVREVTAEVLLFAGYRVLKARTAVEAWAAFRENGQKVHLLLTDVVLPGRNGRALATDLRTTQPGLKTIFISGYPENEVTKQGLDEPGMFYLPKPFSVKSLVKKVREVLEDDPPDKRSEIKPERVADSA